MSRTRRGFGQDSENSLRTAPDSRGTINGRVPFGIGCPQIVQLEVWRVACGPTQSRFSTAEFVKNFDRCRNPPKVLTTSSATQTPIFDLGEAPGWRFGNRPNPLKSLESQLGSSLKWGRFVSTRPANSRRLPMSSFLRPCQGRELA